jgi:hypothetical protein
VVEPQKDSALRTYYGYYVDSCDPPGEITPPSRLVVGSVGERKGAYVWGVPGTIRQKPEAAIQPTPTKPVKVPPLAQLPAIQATPTKSEKVPPLAQLPSYGHVTIRSANCAVLMNGPRQPGALCAECLTTKRFCPGLSVLTHRPLPIVFWLGLCEMLAPVRRACCVL